MPKLSNDVERRKKARPLTYLINRLIVATAIAIILGLLLSLVSKAFAAGLENGIRSLAAAALPPLVIGYITFFTRSTHVPPEEQTSRKLPEVNLYFLSAAWIIVLLLLTDFANAYFNNNIPLGEFAISITLSVLLYFSRRFPFKMLLSSCYGILSGFLVHIILFGLSPRS